MSVRPESPFRNIVRVSAAGFENILRTRANPAVLAERPADEYYRAILDAEQDPLYILAKFDHESSMGTRGVAVTTKSWGNTRLPNFGPEQLRDANGQPVMVPGRTGEFPAWRSWLDGLRSTTARLNAPDYPREGPYGWRAEIREIYEHPSGRVWAPAGDLNNPQGYLRAILDFMNRYQDIEGATVSAQLPGFQWVRSDFFTPGRRALIRGAASHYTAGTASLTWLTKTGGVSATVLIKHNPTLADRGWQLVRMQDTAWTTASANDFTVSREYEHQQGQPIPDLAYTVMAQTWIDMAEWLKRNPGHGSLPLVRLQGSPRVGIGGHKEWVGNPQLTCPDGIDVDREVAEIQRLLAQGGDVDLNNVPAVPDPWAGSNPWFKDKWIPKPFVDFINDPANGGFMGFGYVVSGAFIWGSQLVQYFERERLELNENGTITRGLIGLDALARYHPELVP